MTAYRFGKFRFDSRTGVIADGHRCQHLRPQTARMLALLIARRGRTVSRREIYDAMWPDRTVNFDNSVDVCIRDLRKALSDTANAPRYIRTVPTRGYRFIADVQRLDDSAQAAGQAGQGMLGRHRLSAAALIVAIIALAALPGTEIGNLTDRPKHLAERIGYGVLPVTEGAEKPVVPAAAQAHYFAARAAMVEGEYGQAAEMLEKARKLAPRASYILSGLAYARLHAPGEAGTIAEAARKKAVAALLLDPENGEALSVLGNIALVYEANLEAADAHSRAALAAAPRSVYAHHSRAAFLAAKGDHRGALRHMEIALSENPVTAPTLGDYAWMLRLAGRFDDSLAACDRLGSLIGNHARVRHCRFRAWLGKGDFSAAAGLIDAELSASAGAGTPATALNAYWRGRLQRLLASGPLSANEHLLAARLHARLGSGRRAVAALRQAFAAKARGRVFVAVSPPFRRLCRRTDFRRLVTSHGLPLPKGCTDTRTDTL